MKRERLRNHTRGGGVECDQMCSSSGGFHTRPGNEEKAEGATLPLTLRPHASAKASDLARSDCATPFLLSASATAMHET